MACLRFPETSSTPNALEPTQLISLKYSGLHSHRPGACTPALTSVPRAFSTRTPTSNVSGLPTVSYTTSTAPGYAIGRPCNDWRSRPPPHAASSSTTASLGSCATTTSAPNWRANSACASKRPTTATATSGYSARSTASAHNPREPAPYTTTRPDGGGGCRVIACNDTENGSANTAASSGTESGTANNMLSWAGIRSA